MLTESVLTQMGAEIDYMRGLMPKCCAMGNPSHSLGIWLLMKKRIISRKAVLPSNDSYQGYYLDQENSLCHFACKAASMMRSM